MKVTDLKVNQLVNVEIEYNGEKLILSSRIEGISDTAIHLATPIRKGVPLIIPVGSEIIVLVRLPYGSFGFNSQVLERQTRPVPVIVVKKPEQFFSIAQKRTYVRLPVNLPLRFKIADEKDNSVHEGLTIDISAGGLLFTTITTTAPVSDGNNLQIELYLGESEVLCSPAKVMRVFKDEEDGPRINRVAVEFIDISEVQRDRIFKFIFEKQREWLRKGLMK